MNAKNIILATGSEPSAFPGIPYDEKTIISSTGLIYFLLYILLIYRFLNINTKYYNKFYIRCFKFINSSKEIISDRCWCNWFGIRISLQKAWQLSRSR